MFWNRNSSPIDADHDEPEVDEVDQEESDALHVKFAEMAMERLVHAIEVVQRDMPPFAARSRYAYEHEMGDIPPAVQRARERAIIAAYGLIAREFDGDLGGNS